jgi:hypothetical protein
VALARPGFGLDAALVGISTGTRKSCGIKATAALPQRETGVQTLAYQPVFADNALNGIVAFKAQHLLL